MIYLVIDKYVDLESHFDLIDVYKSKNDLLPYVKDINKKGYKIYSCNKSTCYEFIEEVDIKDLLNEVKENEEYELYLKLKEKYECNNK